MITDQSPGFGIDPFSGIQGGEICVFLCALGGGSRADFRVGMSTTAEGFFGSLVQQGLPGTLSMC